jgi:hypothetical protein
MKKLIEYDGKVYQISKAQYDLLMDKQSNIHIPGINVQDKILAKDKYNEYLYLVIKSAKLIKYPKFYKIP